MKPRLVLVLALAATLTSTGHGAGPSDENDALRDAFFARYKGHMRTMRVVFIGGTGLQKLGHSIDPILAEIRAGCEGEFKAVLDDPRVEKDPLRDPKAWCAAAVDPSGTMSKKAGERAEKGLESMVKSVLEVRDGLAAKDAVLTYPIEIEWGAPAELAKRIADYRARFSEAELDDAVFAPLTEAHKALWDEVARLAPTLERRAIKGHDAGPERVAAAKVAEAGLQVTSTGLARTTWNIELDSRKRPLHRSLPVVVLARRSGEQLCREIVMSYVEKHDGKSYLSPGTAGLGDWRFVPCPASK